MINNDYFIDDVSYDSGGYCDFLPIKGYPELGFKSFNKKSKSVDAWNNQKLLAQFDLAPEPLSGICKIPYFYEPAVLKHISPENTLSGWGFITEKADLIVCDNESKIPYRKIQKLVDDIWKQTHMKFWDCHENNVGYVKRGRAKKLVCIDTGKESFDSYSNAWGFQEPGPKCPYCLKYQCRCSEY